MEFSTIFKIIVLIILFSILGINVFAYLAKGTDVLSKLTQKCIKRRRKSGKGRCRRNQRNSKEGQKGSRKSD